MECENGEETEWARQIWHSEIVKVIFLQSSIVALYLFFWAEYVVTDYINKRWINDGPCMHVIALYLRVQVHHARLSGRSSSNTTAYDMTCSCRRIVTNYVFRSFMSWLHTKSRKAVPSESTRLTLFSRCPSCWISHRQYQTCTNADQDLKRKENSLSINPLAHPKITVPKCHEERMWVLRRRGLVAVPRRFQQLKWVQEDLLLFPPLPEVSPEGARRCTRLKSFEIGFSIRLFFLLPRTCVFTHAHLFARTHMKVRMHRLWCNYGRDFNSLLPCSPKTRNL